MVPMEAGKCRSVGKREINVRYLYIHLSLTLLHASMVYEQSPLKNLLSSPILL